MDLKAKIQDDMKAAMKSQEAEKLGTIRMLYAEVKKREIDKRAPLETGEIHKAVQTLINQRNDSIEAFTKAGRTELAEKEKREIEFLRSYMPQQMSRSELETLVADVIRETGAKGPNDIGKVMKATIAKTEGRADGKLVNEIARTKLTQG